MIYSRTITLELLYRLSYGFALLGFLISHDYLCLGFESEYFEILSLKKCQDCSFCFETLCQINPNVQDSITKLSHQSYSWHKLSLASLSYFYPVIIQGLSMYHKLKYFLIFSMYSHWAWLSFSRPALLNEQGHVSNLLFHSLVLMALVLFTLLQSYILIIQESYIETLDSELLSL